MKFTIRTFSVILCCGLLACACRHKPEIREEEEYLDFIRQLVEAAYSEQADPQVFTDAFDNEAFAERILAQGDLAESEKEKTLAFLSEYFKPGHRMLARVEAGADYQLIRFYMSHDTAHALFRIYNETITYEDWIILVRDGRFRIIDISDPISGMYWSEEWNMNTCAYLGVSSDHFLINEKLIAINQWIGRKEFGKADSLFTWVEQATATNAYAQALRMNLISQSQSYDSLRSFCGQFLQRFPDRKATVAFFSLQRAISDGNMDKVRLHCNELMEALGDDPIFYLYLAWGYKASGNMDASMAMLDKLIGEMPLQYDFYNYQLDLYYEKRDVQGFIRQMDRIDSLFSASDEDIPFYENAYPAMQSTPEFKAWKKRHQEKLTKEQAAL